MYAGLALFWVALVVAPNAIRVAFLGVYSEIPRAWVALVAAPNVIRVAFVGALMQACKPGGLCGGSRAKCMSQSLHSV